MKPYALVILLSLGFFAAAHHTADQPGGSKQEKESDDYIDRIQALLDQDLIDVKALPDDPDDATLPRMLAALEAQLPKEKRIAIQLDEKALAKDLAVLKEAKVLNYLRHKVSLRAALNMILSCVPDEIEVDYAIRPEGIVITRPKLTVYPHTYEIRDIAELMPLLLPELKKYSWEGDVYQDIKPTDGTALVMRRLANDVDLKPWESIRVLNGSRLAVVASPGGHSAIATALSRLRDEGGLAVVMNARLYEVDRDFFTKHVAPLYAKDGVSNDRPAVIGIYAQLLKLIMKTKLLMESDETRILPQQDAVFLSHLTMHRFTAGSRARHWKAKPSGSILEGVSFHIRPLVSADRRNLRLPIVQEVTQLKGIDKRKQRDLFTKEESEVEIPNVANTSVAGTIDILDGNPILMPVHYRPLGTEAEDKVWLLVARPFLWIDDEMEEMRKAGKNVRQTIWESEVREAEKEEKRKPEKVLPSDKQTKELLQAVITDVLTNPDLESSRKFYGTARDKTFTLHDSKLGWPKDFNPEKHGFELVQVPYKPDPFNDLRQRRVLGIRIDKFDLKQKKGKEFDAPIKICIFNAGGNANGGVIGGCFVSYSPKRVGKRWTVEFEGAFDP